MAVGIRWTEEEYRKFAADRALKLVGEVPRSITLSTEWECLRCGVRLRRSLNKLKDQPHRCPITMAERMTEDLTRLGVYPESEPDSPDALVSWVMDKGSRAVVASPRTLGKATEQELKAWFKV